MRHRRRLFELAVVIAVLGSAPAAEGAFPGRNGRLAMSLGFYPAACRAAGVGGETVTFRPDGSRSGSRLKCVGPLRVTDASSPDWSPDGRRLLAASSKGVVLMGADGSHARAVTSPPRVGEQILDPSFAPDGRHFVYERIDERGGSLWRATISGGTQRRLGFGSSPRWSPDGRTIAYSRSSASGDRVLLMDARTGRRVRRLPEGTRALDWSPDGRRLVLAPRCCAGVWIVRADGKGVPRGLVIKSGPTFVQDAAWSPDGRRIALAGYQRDERQGSVWTTSPRGTAQKRVFRGAWVDSEESGAAQLSWGVRPG
jgi:Tol biopolymer transport system component